MSERGRDDDGRDWCDDGDQLEVVRRAERATRFGWAAITGVAGLLGCALIAVPVVLLGAVVACAYVVMAAQHP
ncbi:hypothetical protein [Streptomyces sp. NPDC001480]|uniref:hypothetical protein n=1 Tax=Streptomyces sp. NPDC001480 TaxID=3364577 RepID=UPI00369274F5